MERYRLPVPVQSYTILAPKVSSYYPQLQLGSHPNQQKINTVILHKVNMLFSQVNEMGYFHPGVTEFLGNYEMKNNERGIVSFTFTLMANMPSLAHPIDLMDSLTADVQTGEIYDLKELFKPGSDYEERINQIIRLQIQERDIPLLDEFPGISPHQKYYIADKTLVIYFDEYEITPGYVSFPMFPIPSYQLQDIAEEDSPLYILST